ncbi:MAG: branched-chain amino acid ABC transporter permease [Burkholderiaceae bacterium]
MQEGLLLALNLLWQVSTLALLTLGLGIVFGLLRIMNMAHGEFVMLGAYAPVVTSLLGWSAWWQVPVCVVLVGAVAWLCERLLIRHFYDRLFDSLLATWGLSILLREAVELVFGRQYQSVAQPLAGTTEVFGVSYPSYRLLMMALMALGFIGLFAWYRRSLAATRIRAMVANPVLARAIGIPTGALSCATFVTGCVIAGLAGLMIAPLTRVEPLMGLDDLLRSFFALIVGGLGSLEGLVIGTAIVGGLQTGVSSWIGPTTGYVAILMLSILFLWLRPDGIARRR